MHQRTPGAGEAESGLACLPVELVAAILDHVGDRDFCHCLQAGALFWAASSDAAVEVRKRRWRGCREPHDFCATGNIEAIALLWDRQAAFDARLCVANAIAHGHADRVLDLLGRIGLVDRDNVPDAWRQDACREAAKNGRIDVLAVEWHTHLGSDCVIEGAIQGDHLAAFLWACEACGAPPQRLDICHVLDGGAMTILAHCRRACPNIALWTALAMEAAADETMSLDAVFVCMGDDTPRHARSRVCDAICRHASLCDIEIFYMRFPDLFNGWPCLAAAADEKNLDVARWLCDRFPDWSDHLADQLVGLEPINRIHALPIELGVRVEWLYDMGLVGNVPRLARIAAERGALGLLARIVDRELLSTASPFDEIAMERSGRAQDRSPAEIKSAVVTGALARLFSAGDGTVFDWLEQRGLCAAPHTPSP
ncbi:hypothetical protein pdul_cds_843 [Pandoravirus dulcis]|uniref:Ankyrin repeat domain containing protein n=1 Tax=Pandoravirus dulcis TaxID=1349409 RepID=S4VYC5_9VIRU|nr:hypothetical protein pdul_cds_843 [Pandoravirus dulcis]AGO83056.1 hypothetical protein pdul_cds_843 [Pandoravirus dulcis]